MHIWDILTITHNKIGETPSIHRPMRRRSMKCNWTFLCVTNVEKRKLHLLKILCKDCNLAVESDRLSGWCMDFVEKQHYDDCDDKGTLQPFEDKCSSPSQIHIAHLLSAREVAVSQVAQKVKLCLSFLEWVIAFHNFFFFFSF